eukprot:3937209-Rhodomonas_salina.2
MQTLRVMELTTPAVHARVTHTLIRLRTRTGAQGGAGSKRSAHRGSLTWLAKHLERPPRPRLSGKHRAVLAHLDQRVVASALERDLTSIELLDRWVLVRRLARGLH